MVIDGGHARFRKAMVREAEPGAPGNLVRSSNAVLLERSASLSTTVSPAPINKKNAGCRERGGGERVSATSIL
jgi:hypothetical protein